MLEQSRVLTRRTAGREMTALEISAISGGWLPPPPDAGTVGPSTGFSPDTMTFVGTRPGLRIYEPDDCSSDLH